MSLSYCEEQGILKSNENPEQEVNEWSTNWYTYYDNRNDSYELLEQIFFCIVNNCGKEFRYKYLYKRHLRRFHSHESLLCDHWGCDYVTADETDLKYHQIVHSDERPFTCYTDGCGKTFKTKNCLESHQKRHKKELLKCTLERCEQTFTGKRSLKRHITDIHPSVPKSYLCRACDQSFYTLGKRMYHQKQVHQTLDKPIICGINNCNQEFTSQYYYRDHIRRCHSGQEYQSDQSGCDYVTKTAKLMNGLIKSYSESGPFVSGIDDLHSRSKPD